MLRIVTVGAVLIALMFAVKDEQLLQRAHLVGYCSTLVRGTDGSEWRSCVPGKIAGRPGLVLDGCTDVGRHGNAEIWGCPARLEDTFRPPTANTIAGQ